MIFLHGGWGYEVYPFSRQIAAFERDYRIIIPDRTGYGASTRVSRLDPGFHHAAAVETLAFLDALRIESALLWGHSDGAVIATLVALSSPDRVTALVLEATHRSAAKPASRRFFEATASDPASVGKRAAAVLAHDHGNDWMNVVARHSEAWLAMASETRDFYSGRLGQLRVPVLVIHGEKDPRTEPGELTALRHALSHATFHVFSDAGHSPHSEDASADEITRVAATFLSHVRTTPLRATT